MNNADAIVRAMGALEARATFTVSTRRNARAVDDTDAEHVLDAAAWNALEHLRKII